MVRFLFTLLVVFSFGYSYGLRSEVIALPEIGDSAGALISPQQEYQIGQSFYWRLQQSIDLIDDPELTNYLQQLGQRLVTHSDGANLHFEFFLVPDPRINAFAAPGGFIGINSGLFLTSEQEDELASVLAHEIAHITQRHLLRTMEKLQRSNIPRIAALVGAILLGAADPQAGAAALTVVQASGLQAQIDYTRSHEKEADNLGMQNLVQAGFNPRAMPLFFERLMRNNRFHSGNAIPEFLRTHPITSSRIAEARGRAVQYPVRKLRRDSLSFALMKERLRVLTTSDYKTLEHFYRTKLNQADVTYRSAMRYGYGLTMIAMGRYDEAKKIIKALVSNDRERLTYQLTLGELALLKGDVEQALTIYAANQHIYPDDYALSIHQAQAFLQADSAKLAVNLLLKQLALGRDTNLVYKLLARSYDKLGQQTEAHGWLAEFYYGAGRHQQALEQLNLAVKAALGDSYLRAKFNARIKQIEAVLETIDQGILNVAH